MNSRLYRTTLVHTRFRPKRHTFTYPFLVMAIDLDEIADLECGSLLFGYNRLRPFSIRDRDYLRPGAGNLRSKLDEIARENGEPTTDGRKVVVVTSPKFFGFGFNPVSFYYCYDPDGSPLWILAEVNNTFGERHFYFLHPEGTDKTSAQAHYEKTFHVSPFLERKGEYKFSLSEPGDSLVIGIELVQDGEPILAASMRGKSAPATSWDLFKSLIQFPLTRCLTMLRIYKQAAALHFWKRVGFFSKPVPCSDNTVAAKKPGWLQRFARRILEEYLIRLRTGRLEVRYPDGSRKAYGNPEAAQQATIRIRDPRFFTRTIFGGEIGFGDSYVKGEWDSPDPVALIEILIANMEAMGQYRIPFARVVQFFHVWRNRGRKNSLKGSRKNISDHYDLSDALFRSFLDESMTYSCALYKNETSDLSEAQQAKLDRMMELARVTPGDRLLEIGSGWGSFALRAVEKLGGSVTTTTISKNQFRHLSHAVEERRLSDKIEVLFSDYRELPGSGLYDKIVSIEMLEAVGREYLGRFFEVCRRLLKPDGRLALQVITIPDKYFSAYEKSCDWIQKRIFPGGFLPSLGAIEQAGRRYGGFRIEQAQDIGIHYARTLRDWRNRFMAQKEKAIDLGCSEEFFRKWIYYFCYCEAAFASRYLSVHQIALAPIPAAEGSAQTGK